MSKDLHYAVAKTPAGFIEIRGSVKGLTHLNLKRNAKESPQLFNDLIGRLNAYFSGKKTTFPDKLDLSSATDFQKKVWEMTRLIPYGETRSYKWLAERLGKPGATRAVGQALAKNPLPIIIPCHRVIASSGGLGGYSGGIELKKELLKLEANANRG